MVSRLLTGVVLTVTAGFAVVYGLVLGNFYPLINSPVGFFGSANVLMYVTIEGLFLFMVLYAAYMSVRRREYKD